MTSNANKWEKPSGKIGKCGLPEGPPYEGKFEFGWEEWFLYDFHNTNSQLDGYCFGFIQVFHKKNKAKDVIDRLHLYTKVCENNSNNNYYLGYIDNVEVLKQPFKHKNILDKKKSFCKQAESDLWSIVKPGYQKDLLQLCSEDTLFNVRFKSSDVHIKDFNFRKRPIKLLQGQSRFGLYDLDKHTNLINEIKTHQP